MPYRQALLTFQRDYWQSLMCACDGNVKEIAFRAKVSRTNLYRIFAKLGIEVTRDNIATRSALIANGMKARSERLQYVRVT